MTDLLLDRTEPDLRVIRRLIHTRGYDGLCLVSLVGVYALLALVSHACCLEVPVIVS